MGMLRLVRAFTGRQKIVKFDGCYHGHADGFLVQAGSGVATLGLPDSPGERARLEGSVFPGPMSTLSRCWGNSGSASRACSRFLFFMSCQTFGNNKSSPNARNEENIKKNTRSRKDSEQNYNTKAEIREMYIYMCFISCRYEYTRINWESA